MPGVEYPSLTFDGSGRYNRKVIIAGGVRHYPKDREGEYIISIYRKHFWLGFLRNFKRKTYDTYFEPGRDKGIIDLRNYYEYFDSNLINGKQYSLEIQANFIKEHLMPVIEGEVWIDKLIKSKK